VLVADLAVAAAGLDEACLKPAGSLAETDEHGRSGIAGSRPAAFRVMMPLHAIQNFARSPLTDKAAGSGGTARLSSAAHACRGARRGS
jgi:hypothetical protein